MGISNPCYFRMKAHWYKEELVSVEIYFSATWGGFEVEGVPRYSLCHSVYFENPTYKPVVYTVMRPLMNWVFRNPFLTNVLVRQLKVPIRLSAVWKNKDSDALQHMVWTGMIDTTPNCLILWLLPSILLWFFRRNVDLFRARVHIASFQFKAEIPCRQRNLLCETKQSCSKNVDPILLRLNCNLNRGRSRSIVEGEQLPSLTNLSFPYCFTNCFFKTYWENLPPESRSIFAQGHLPPSLILTTPPSRKSWIHTYEGSDCVATHGPMCRHVWYLIHMISYRVLSHSV